MNDIACKWLYREGKTTRVYGWRPGQAGNKGPAVMVEFGFDSFHASVSTSTAGARELAAALLEMADAAEATERVDELAA